MELLVIGVVILAAAYLLRNWKRNSDPLNRKCAAEICEYLTSSSEVSVEGVREIFMRNARYQTQANHVLSMVPALLIKAGYPRDASMSFVPLMRAAAASVPQ
jgi:hypothetical protein